MSVVVDVQLVDRIKANTFRFVLSYALHEVTLLYSVMRYLFSLVHESFARSLSNVILFMVKA